MYTYTLYVFTIYRLLFISLDEMFELHFIGHFMPRIETDENPIYGAFSCANP